MDVVLSILNYDAWSCRCSCMGSMSVVMQRFVLCDSPQCFILHDLQFVNAVQGCKGHTHDCLIGLCVCSEML